MLYTIKQASNFLRVHPSTLRRWEKEGKIIPHRIGTGKHRRYTPYQLNELLIIIDPDHDLKRKEVRNGERY